MASLLNLFSKKDAPTPSRTKYNDEDKKLRANLPNKSGKPSLSLFGQSERININCNANSELNVASSIQAIAETGKEGDRLPIEIAIALDVSGSMHGEKLQLCQDTLELIAKYLLPKDKISITTFDTDVKQIFKLSPMTSSNKQMLEKIIKKVRAGSSTNLSGGLMDAIGVLKESKVKDNVVKACILLTDGHANHGIRDMSALSNLVKSELAGTSIALFTYGYGANHNVNGLQQLSHQSDGGSYYFVDKEDNISSAIGDCLGGIMSVVAQNIVLEAKPAVEGVRIHNCYEENREVTVSNDGVYKITFGDLYAGERRDTIFKIAVDPARCPQKNAPLVAFKIKYLDALNMCTKEFEVLCGIDRVEDNEVDVDLTNKNVSLQVVRAVSGKALGDANNLADKCKFEEARKIISQTLVFLEQYKNKVNDMDAYNALVADLNETMKAMQNRLSWNGSAGYYAKSKAKMHQAQRCAEEHEDTYSSYRTSYKRAYSKAMKKSAKSMRSK